MIGPGDYEAFPNDGDPRDPRNDYDEAETLTPEQDRKAEEEAAYDKWESRQ